MAEIDEKKKAAQQIYQTVDGTGKGWDYAKFENLFLNDGGYRKNIYDNFGGANEFGEYDSYNGYFEDKPVAEKKKDIPDSKTSSAASTTPSTNLPADKNVSPSTAEVQPPAKTEPIKEEKPDELKIEADKLNSGQLDNVDMNKVIDYYKKTEEKPSNATLQRIKDYTDVKAKSVADQAAKMESLATAIESANKDIENAKTSFPGLDADIKKMQELSAKPKEQLSAAEIKDYNDLFEKTTTGRGVVEQRQKVAKNLFEQYTAIHDQLKSDVASLQGAKQFYGDQNYWYDKNKSLGDNLLSVGRSFERGVVMGQANVMKQLDGLSKIIGDATGTTPSGIFGRVADKLKAQVTTNIDLNDDVETVATKLSTSAGGMIPMFTELMLTPEIKVKGLAIPKFVTYMSYSTALDKFNARADELAKTFNKPYEELPMDLKSGAYGELAKGGVVGAGEGAILHVLNLGAMRYGSNIATRAALSGSVFAGYDALKQKIQTGEINDKDVIASFLLGTAMSLQGEATGGGPKTKEKVDATKEFWSSAMKAPEKAVEGPLMDAYMQTRPDLVTELEKIQELPSEAERIEKISEFRDKTMQEIPDEFKRSFFETNDIMKGEEFDFLKLNKQEADKNAADFENAQPKSLADIATSVYRGNTGALKDVFDFGRVLNKYQLSKDANGLKEFVSDGLSIEATPAELMEIQAIMKDNYVDFLRAKSYGSSVGADEQQWNEKMKDIFGGGNTRLLDVLSKMNSRQRALLLARLIDTQQGEIMKPTTGKEALANDLGTGKTADIPVEGGGKFRVTLAEKIAHVISAKSLKDVYGFNYNKDASNASRTFWQMSRESARESMTNENLAEAGEAAEDLINQAATEVKPEVAQAKRISAQFIQQVININREAKAIAQNPEKYITAIRDDETLTQPQREEYYKMIDDVLQNKGAVAAQAAIISQQIQQLQADMNSIPSDKPAPEKTAIAEHIQEQIDAKTQEIKDLYANYEPAKDRAAKLPVDEFTPEQEQKLKKAVEGSDELRDELLDILRIKEPEKKQAKISEFKNKVLADLEKTSAPEKKAEPVKKSEEAPKEEKPKPIIDYDKEMDSPISDLHTRFDEAKWELTEQTDPLVSQINELRPKLKGASVSEKKAIVEKIRDNEMKISELERVSSKRSNADLRELKDKIFKASGKLDVPLTDGETIKVAQDVMERVTNKAAKNWDMPLSQVIDAAILDFGKEEKQKEVSKTASYTEVSGGVAEVRLADNTKKMARFAAVEADELLTSHDPFTFSENKDFPTKNDRDYTLKENQANVLTTEKDYDTRGISDNPGVAEGSPVVTWDAELGKYVVLSGNERIMAFTRALKYGSGAVKKEKGQRSDYEKQLAHRAERYGLEADAITKMKSPVFVRVIEEPVEYSTAEMSKYNPRAVGKTKSAKEMIGTMREKISDEQRERLARIIEEADADKLSEIWNNPKVAKIIYDYLIASDIINIKEVPALFLTKAEGARVFTETGKELFKTILASGIIDEKVLQYKDVVGVTSLYNTITSGLLVPLFEIKKNNPALIKTINDALLLQAKTSLAGLKSVAFYLNQGSMFVDKDIQALSPQELSEAAEMLILLQYVGVDNLRAALIGLNDASAYNKQQRANPGMFDSTEVNEAAIFQERMAEWRKIAEGKIKALLNDKSITNELANRETELLAATQKDKKPIAGEGPSGSGKKVDPVSKKPAPENKKVEGPDIDDIFDEFDKFNIAEEEEIPYGTPEVKAEQIATGQKLIKALTSDKANPIHKFDDMLVYMVGRFGEDRAMRNFDALKMAYGAFLAVAPDEITNQMTELSALKKMQPSDILTKIKSNGNPNLPNTGSDNTPGVDVGVEQGKVNGTGEVGAVENIPDNDSGTGAKGEGDGNVAGADGSGSNGNNDGKRPRTGTGGKQGTGGDKREGVGDNNEELGINERDHIISPEEIIVPKGETSRINANIDAIKLLRQLESDNRNATPAEKAVLAKFTGWGGFGEVLNRDRYLAKDAGWMKKYAKLHEEIAGLLTDDELTAAINSTISAHYTPREVISSIWSLADKLGFKGGHVLESSAGVGHFFGLMPTDIHAQSRLTGYELDGITGRLLAKLYPQANIKVQGFEHAQLSPNSIDLAITNVPFGRTAPYDSSFPELSKFSLHNYFIAKNILMLKPGGLGVFITSASTMDNGASAKFREWVAKEGNTDFVGAIRLPNNAFKDNAGTEVTADILVFRKRADDLPSTVAQDFRFTKPIREVEVDGKSKNIEVNEYFAAHPEMMLGEMKFASEAGTGGLYRGDSQTLVAPATQDTQLALQNAVSKLPADIFGAAADVNRKVEFSEEGDKTGTIKVKDGMVYQVFGNELRPVGWGVDKIKYGKKEIPASVIAKQYIDIKDALSKLLDAELSKDTPDENIEALRGNLRKAYRIFTENYGTLNKPGRANKIKFLEDDVEFDAISAIESVNYRYENTEGGKLRRVAEIVPAQILTKRVNYPIIEPEKAKDAADAILISISYKNKIDIPYIARLLDLDEGRVKEQLINDGLAFENPANGLLEDKDSYLSGFVREKLKLAQSAASANPAYEKNVEALQKVIPADIPPLLIKFKLGTPWMPTNVTEDWLAETLGVNARLHYNSQTGMWIAEGVTGTSDGRNTSIWGTGDFSGWELVEKALNLSQPSVTKTVKNADGGKVTVKDIDATAAAQAKQAELMDNYVNWVRDKKVYDDDISKIYNETYNSYVEKKYSLPSFDTFPGAAVIDKKGRPLKLRQHQKKAVMRILQDSTLLAHQVGTGKTYTIATAVMEMKRLGRARKPIIVVQNATVGQFADAFRTLYPQAKLLVPSANQRDASNRRKLFAMIAYNDWDSIIIPQSFAPFIPDDPDRVNAFIQEQIDELSAVIDEIDDGSYESRGRVHELNKALEKLEEQKRKSHDDGYIIAVQNLVEDLELEGSDEALDKAKQLNLFVNNYNAVTAQTGLSREDKVNSITSVVQKIKSEIENSSQKIKDIARQQLAIERSIRKQTDRKTDEIMTFEKMGVDAMYYDEAHANKKLGFFTKMNNIKGIDTGRSQRAFSTFMKANWIQELNQGKNVVFATGTPITNTMAEVWTMMKFIQPDVLRKYQITNFDQFAATFGSVEPSLEFTAAGKFKVVERFKSYINAPELLTAFRSKTDVVLTEDIPEFKEDKTIPKLKPTNLDYVAGVPYLNGIPIDNIPVTDDVRQAMKDAINLLNNPDRATLLDYFTNTSPNPGAVEFLQRRGFSNVIIPQSAALKAQMDEFRAEMEWFEKLSGKEKRKYRHIPLLIFNRAKQAAIDLRLLDPDADDDPGSKTNRVVKDAIEIYHNTTDIKGTQLIFSDMYQSPSVKSAYLDEEQTIPNPAFGKKRFNLYQDIKQKLIAGGIPENEIVIIHDLGTGKSADAKRSRVFEMMQQGKVRVMLGSTEKMGVGVNVQDKMVALHHVDAPPRPMDFEQRNGRGLRQGNELAYLGIDFDIRTYGVEKTLDATAYGRLAIKQKFINQMMKGEGLDREMNDEADEDNPADMSFEQRMAALSGSQYAVIWHAKTYELRKMETASKNHDRRLIQLNQDIKYDRSVLSALQTRVPEINKVVEDVYNKIPDGNITTLKRGEETYTDKFATVVDSVIKGLIIKTVQDGKKHIEQIEINGVPVLFDSYIFGGMDRPSSLAVKPEEVVIHYALDPHHPEQFYDSYLRKQISAGVGFINSLRNRLEWINTEANDIHKRIATLEQRIPIIESELQKKFPNADKLSRLRTEVADVEEKMKEEVVNKTELEEGMEKKPDNEDEEGVVEESFTPQKAADLLKSSGYDVPEELQNKIEDSPSEKEVTKQHVDIAYGSEKQYKEAVESLSDRKPATDVYVGEIYKDGSLVSEPLTIRENSVKEQLDKKMSFDVTGALIDSPETLADIFSAIRNPHMEIASMVYLRNDEVVHATFHTLGLPEATMFKGAKDIVETARAMGADNVMMVHNHPSGNHVASMMDVNTTTKTAEACLAQGIKFGGHVVINTDKFSFIASNGNVSEKEYKLPVESFHYERAKIGRGDDAIDNMFLVAKAILKQKNLKTAIVYLSAGGHVHGFEPVSMDEMRAPYFNQRLLTNRNKYGAAKYVVITDGEEVSGVFPYGLLDIIDTKNNVSGVNSFKVRISSDSNLKFIVGQASSSMMVNEDTVDYGPEKRLEDLFKDEDKDKLISDLHENITKLSKDLAATLKIHEGFLLKDAELKPAQAAKRAMDGMTEMSFIPPGAIKAVGVVSSRIFNAPNRIDVGVLKIPVQDFLSDKIVGGFEEWLAKGFQKTATSRITALRELSDVAVGWLRGVIDNKAYVTERGLLKGGIATGGEAANRMGKALREIIGNNSGSLEKIISVMDPELHLHFGAATQPVYETLAADKARLYKEIYNAQRLGLSTAALAVDLNNTLTQMETLNNVALTPEEVVVKSLLGTLNTITHDTNMMMGLMSGGTMGINQETWEKFRNPVTGKADYIARSYNWTEEDEDAKALTQQIMAEMGIYKKRTDVTMDKVLEAIKDPVYLTVKRYAQTMKNLSIFEYSRELFTEQAGKGVLTTAQFTAKFGSVPAAKVDHGFVRMPGFGYGLLSNKWVAKHYAEDLKGYMYNTYLMSKFNDVAQAYDNLWLRRMYRAYFTVLNPGVVAGNIAMNYVWAFKAGINPVAFMGYLPKATMEIRNGGPAYMTMLRNGLIGNSITLANLQGEAVGKKGFLKSAKAFYGGVDDVAKIQAFLVLTDLNGYTPEEAISQIRDSFQTSEEVGRYWDLAAKTPLVGNMFARFVAQAIRIEKNNVVKRPFYTIAWYSFISFLTFALMKGDEDSEELSKEEKGVWQDFATSVPRSAPTYHYDNSDKQWKWGDMPLSLIINGKRLDIARFVEPLYIWDQGDDYQSYIQWVNKASPFPFKGEKTDNGIRKLKFMYADPILGPLFQAMDDQDFRMRSVQDPSSGKWGYDVNLDDKDRLKNIASYLTRAYGGQYVALVDDVWNASRGEPDRYGRYKTVSDAFLNLLVKVQRFDDKEVARAVTKRFQSHDREFENMKYQLNNTLDQYHREVAEVMQDEKRSPEQRETALKDITDKYYSANQSRYEKVLNWMVDTKKDIDEINQLADNTKYAEFREVIKGFQGDEKYVPTLKGKRGYEQKKKGQQGKMEELRLKAEQAVNVNREEIQQIAEDEVLKGKDNEERARLIYKSMEGKDPISQQQMIKNYIHRGVVTNQTLIYLNRLRK